MTGYSIPADHYRAGRLGPVDVLVLHTAEGAVTADALGRYFERTSRVVSAHSGVDDHERRDYLGFEHTAYAAPGANADGEQLELCGFASWSRDTWLAHGGMLEQAARWLAARCLARHIPPVLLDAADLRADKRGITTHAAVSAAFRRSTHTDPGTAFPLELVLSRVKHLLTPGSPAASPSSSTPPVKAAPPWPGVVLRRGSSGLAVSRWQRQMRQRGWRIGVDGRFGAESESVARAFQREKHLHVDGRVGRDTWRASWTARVT